MTVKLPNGNGSVDVNLPDSLELLTYQDPKSIDPIPSDEFDKLLHEKISDPIGMNSLEQLIDDNTSIAIVVDDISRPTPTPLILEPLIQYFENELSVPPENIVFIFGLGVHREMTEEEAETKLGKKIADKYSWENHNCRENLEDLGESSYGTPILVNKTYYDADFKISVGLIEPHLWAGFSGGHKGIIPGIAGVDTIYHNHQLVKHSEVDVGNLDNNPFRDDLEEMVSRIGLDLLVNVVLTPSKEIYELVIGDVDRAFQQGVKISRQISELSVPKKSDVVISSPHPLGIDFRQSSKGAFNTMKALKKGGTMIVVSDCPEGAGNVTASDDPPSRWLIKLLAKILPSKMLMWIIRKQGYGVEDAAGTFRMFKFISKYNYIFVSPNMTEEERELLFVADHYDTLDEALEKLNNKGNMTVNIFPQGGSTYPKITG